MALKRGDIINIAHGRRGGLAVVLEPARDPDDPRPPGADRKSLGRKDFLDRLRRWIRAAGAMSLPKRVEHKQPRVRRDLASALLSAAEKLPRPSNRSRRGDRDGDNSDADPELLVLRESMRRHPAHRLADREAQVRIAERYLRVERDNQHIRKKIDAATNSLAATFDRIVVLLSERGFIQSSGGDLRVTDDGRLLARIYSESDLLVAECLRSGAWNGLQPAELAAVISAMVFEARGSDGPTPANVIAMPTAGVRKALADTRRLSTRLRADEVRHRIAPTREPDEGFVPAVHRWATTGNLAAALDASDVAGSGTPLSAGTSSDGAVRCWICSIRSGFRDRINRCVPRRNAPSTTSGAASWLLMAGRVIQTLRWGRIRDQNEERR